jgi:hypothetical protein
LAGYIYLQYLRDGDMSGAQNKLFFWWARTDIPLLIEKSPYSNAVHIIPNQWLNDRKSKTRSKIPSTNNFFWATYSSPN